MSNLVASHPENGNALRHGLYSPRVLDARAREIVDALMTLEHVTPLDVFGVEELASCISALEVIDGELARNPRAAARKTLLERKTSLGRELRAWLREVGATPGFDPARDLAGLPGHLTLHDLRHAAASRLIRAGLDPVAVASVLGHENANITLAIYGHLYDRQRTDEAVRQALAASA